MFLGQLREAEVERINDRISQAVMETCLAMTIFREEFNVEFCTMFTVLTFLKVSERFCIRQINGVWSLSASAPICTVSTQS